ncbi:hypothetical protein CHLNCDRAFT_141330 [Chlorella variabilis]|uniref:Uncharacterized protein n=1 Tax=Chlorella variabilis TaxID=554065 RepID=E1ZSM9_CHLVA|nr:hypothetical protein CHLNCDRAFT_141330 [Chlorella variabilis]EFN51132.1 hypothetical protein CHLNCDRAFT_141330 [Chlorella variabilis]|eukprot:XP_005843234.1 hypothetical protein CHLNCDRAFT_141330 [Chlorella variabilis]
MAAAGGGDLRAGLFSGDPLKQTAALMSGFAALSAGRDVAPLVSAALQLLGNPSTAVEPKRVAYDFAMAAQLADADLARLAVVVQADMQKGVPHEVRVKALQALPLLPGHRLEALLTTGGVLERLFLNLRSSSDAVRAASIEAAAEVTAHERTLQAAAESPALLSALIDLWESITDALTDETDLVCASACAALAQLLQAEDGGAAPLPAGPAAVLSPLTDCVHKRLGGLLGVALARFRALGTVLVVAVPPLLVAYLRGLSPLPEERRLDALPGDVGSVGRCHAYEECSVLLVELLHSPNAAVLLAAAEALLQLAKMDGASAVVLSVLPKAAAAIIGAATNAEGQLSAAQPQVLMLLLAHLPVMPAVQQPLLFQRLLPLVAAVPSAAERCRGLARLWAAVLQYDWSSSAADKAARQQRAAAAAATPAAPAPQLQQLLLEPGIKEAVSGQAGSGDVGAALSAAAAAAAPPPVFPAFREELVGSLLYGLLSHPRGSAAVGAGAGAAGASSLLAEASEMQALVESVEWLASAKTALQGTKACLGWDRVTAVLTTGTTAVVDLWLQLLLRTIQAAGAVKAHLAGRQAEAAAAAQAAEGSGRQAVASLSQSVYRRVGAIDMDMQGMLLQIASNWRALHPVVRPRAVWVCCCHLQLKSVLDGAWNSCVDAIRGLLLDSRKSQVGSHVAAVAEGLLAAPPSGGPDDTARHAAGLAAAAGQQAQVAMLCLERLISLVAYNNRDPLAGQLAPIGSLLEKLCKLELENECGPALKERIGRLLAAVLPVATSGKEKGGGAGYTRSTTISIRSRPAEEQAEENGKRDAAPIVVELHPDPAAPAAAAYPNTLPAAAALFGTKEAVRYGHLLEQLQSAAWQDDEAAAAGGDGAAAAAGLPSLLQLTAILAGAGGGAAAAAAAGVEVTGPSTPLALSLSHSMDAANRSISLRCAVHNRTMEAIRGVEVELMLGGPVVPGHRRPLSFQLQALPPAGSTSWETELRVSGFGWPSVQPAIFLPIKLPGGEEAGMRCRPYNLAAAASEPGPAGLQHVMASMQGTSMLCVLRATAPVHGSAHAAFYGSSWDGQRIACVVTGVLDSAAGASATATGGGGGAAGGSGAAAAQPLGLQPARLHFHFRSESAQVISHVQGHEIELLDQLTGGRVVPTAAGEEGSDAAGATAAAPASQASEAEAYRPSTFSFLRSVTLRSEEEEHRDAEGDEGGVDPAAAEAARRAFEGAVLAQWQRLRALRETLHQAVQRPGRHACLQLLYACLAKGADVNSRDKNGCTALHLASWKNPDPSAVGGVIAALVAEGADVRAKNEDGDEPLHWAATNNNAEASVAAVQELLAAGADVRAKNEDGDEPLHWAATNNNAEASVAAVQALVAAGADVQAKDNNGAEPLHWAAYSIAAAAAAASQALLAAGADMRAKNEDGTEPLHWAADNSNAEASVAIVQALVAAGADVRAKGEYGAEPLHWAATNNNAEASVAAVQALVAAGADVRAMNEDGAEPLHWAADNSIAAAAAAASQALLAAGADVRARDDADEEPLHWAAAQNESPVAAAILQQLQQKQPGQSTAQLEASASECVVCRNACRQPSAKTVTIYHP